MVGTSDSPFSKVLLKQLGVKKSVLKGSKTRTLFKLFET